MLSRIPLLTKRPRVSILRLSGVIAGGGRVSGLSDATIGPVIDRAFRRRKPVAVALLVNSPGGSPVQSSLIGARIRRAADETGIPVLAFVEDVAASGGYWLASAADEIWVDDSSVVGSIGVISSSFGAHEFLGRYGLERRVHTAGRSKSFLDPFLPEKETDVARLRGLLEDIHTTFIDHVKARRGDRLATSEDLFTGEVWVGRKAVACGLADGVGHAATVLKERFGEKCAFQTFGPRRGLLQRFGSSLMGMGLDALEDRAAFARFGL